MTAVKYPRILAIHEAGHAVVGVIQGRWIDGVHMRTKQEVRTGDKIITERGVAVHAQGLVEGSSMVHPASVKDCLAQGIVIPVHRDFALIDMIGLAAGAVAEARHSRRSVVEIMLFGGGTGDHEEMRARAELLPDPHEAEDEAWASAKQLVRKHWRAVEALADVLQRRRYTPGEQVHAIVMAVAQ
jgi:hypothetical protein